MQTVLFPFFAQALWSFWLSAVLENARSANHRNTLPMVRISFLCLPMLG